MSLKKEDKNMNLLTPEVGSLVREGHAYRRLLDLIDFQELSRELKDCYSEIGRGGYPIESGFKALLLQYMEDLSDRELERFLQENLAGKYFCGFGLTEETPDYSYFSTLRKRIGTERLADLFNRVRDSLKRQNLIRGLFTFVDATQLVSKISTWEERDKAIVEGLERFNNATAGLVGRDKEARFGCKGKEKFWFGFKKQISVDMRHGLIHKVAVTFANLPDHKGLVHVCPSGGMVFGDKGYCPKESQKVLASKGCHSGIILKNNMKGKDRDKDRWLTQVRMPYESVFSQRNKRARYLGIVKNQFQAFMEALVFNFKRLVKIEASPIPLIPVRA
jgi:IS5 family transposase